MRRLGFVFIIIVLICFIGSLAVYVAYRKYPEITVLEPYRKTVDTALSNWWRSNNLSYKVLNSLVFHNGNTYVFRPPRVLPGTDRYGSYKGYILYGLFEAWNPETKLLKLHAYTGKTVWVLYDPEANGTFGVFPKLDKYGVAQGENKRFISASNDTFWATQFCAGDVLVLYTALPPTGPASAQFPIVPVRIELSFRLCDTN